MIQIVSCQPLFLLHLSQNLVILQFAYDHFSAHSIPLPLIYKVESLFFYNPQMPGVQLVTFS